MIKKYLLNSIGKFKKNSDHLYVKKKPKENR